MTLLLFFSQPRVRQEVSGGGKRYKHRRVTSAPDMMIFKETRNIAVITPSSKLRSTKKIDVRPIQPTRAEKELLKELVLAERLLAEEERQLLKEMAEAESWLAIRATKKKVALEKTVEIYKVARIYTVARRLGLI